MSDVAAFAPCLPPPCGTAVASPGTRDRLRNPAKKRVHPVEATGPAAGGSALGLGRFSPRKYAKTG